jgi:hypothetical protein
MGCDREGRTVRLVRHENETATNVLHQSGCVAGRRNRRRKDPFDRPTLQKYDRIC